MCMAKLQRVLSIAIVGMIFLGGCTLPQSMERNAQATEGAMAAEPVRQDPALRITTPEVVSLMNDQNKAASFVLIDARPEVKYEAGHVPGAINIPKIYLEQKINTLSKDKLLIFYCGGTTCKLSAESAAIAQAKGLTNVKVWYEGEPGWKKAGNYEVVETKFVERLVMAPEKETYLLVDARPAIKYRKSFIPTAVNLPNTEFDQKKGLLPADKSVLMIFYCGGADCLLSHKAAKAAMALGYDNVKVYSAGEPVWREAGLPLWGEEAATAKISEPENTEGLPETIDPEEFKTLVSTKGAQFVDVRDPQEFEAGHIPGAINITEEDFIFHSKESIEKLNKKGRIVFYCTTGGRSASSYYAILDESDFVNKANMQYLDAHCAFGENGTYTIEK